MPQYVNKIIFLFRFINKKRKTPSANTYASWPPIERHLSVLGHEVNSNSSYSNSSSSNRRVGQSHTNLLFIISSIKNHFQSRFSPHHHCVQIPHIHTAKFHTCQTKKRNKILESFILFHSETLSKTPLHILIKLSSPINTPSSLVPRLQWRSWWIRLFVCFRALPKSINLTVCPLSARTISKDVQISSCW